ncbi:TPA: pentapeptide repeat-containing protein [Escherichia coli]|nr:pentapeptide repeat-containing protein [Escherichia coli]
MTMSTIDSYKNIDTSHWDKVEISKVFSPPDKRNLFVRIWNAIRNYILHGREDEAIKLIKKDINLDPREFSVQEIQSKRCQIYNDLIVCCREKYRDVFGHTYKITLDTYGQVQLLENIIIDRKVINSYTYPIEIKEGNELNLSGFCFDYSTIDGKDLNIDGEIISKLNLEKCECKHTNFKNINLTNANLKRINGECSNFINCTLVGTNFEQSNLKNANIQGTRLPLKEEVTKGNIVNNINLDKCDCTGSNLDWTVLDSCNNTNFNSTTLRNASFPTTTINQTSAADLSFCNLNRTEKITTFVDDIISECLEIKIDPNVFNREKKAEELKKTLLTIIGEQIKKGAIDNNFNGIIYDALEKKLKDRHYHDDDISPIINHTESRLKDLILQEYSEIKFIKDTLYSKVFNKYNSYFATSSLKEIHKLIISKLTGEYHRQQQETIPQERYSAERITSVIDTLTYPEDDKDDKDDKNNIEKKTLKDIIVDIIKKETQRIIKIEIRDLVIDSDIKENIANELRKRIITDEVKIIECQNRMFINSVCDHMKLLEDYKQKHMIWTR